MDVTLATVSARPLAAVRVQLDSPRVATVFRPYLDQVYATARDAGLALDGQNVFVYRRQPDGSFVVDFGVGVREPFTAVGNVQPLSTPEGLAVMATHVGSYDTLGETYVALRTWCRAHGHTMQGVFWEVYGHWTSDVSQLRTDIHALVHSAAS